MYNCSSEMKQLIILELEIIFNSRNINLIQIILLKR